jgi:hypothetical protein
MKKVRKWNNEGVHVEKHGKEAAGSQESQIKEEICGSTRKTVGFWTNHNQ